MIYNKPYWSGKKIIINNLVLILWKYERWKTEYINLKNVKLTVLQIGACYLICSLFGFNGAKSISEDAIHYRVMNDSLRRQKTVSKDLIEFRIEMLEKQSDRTASK